MNPQFSIAASNRILQENAPLAGAVDAAIWDSRIPASYSEEAGQWASYLHLRGWIEDAKDRAAIAYGADLWRSQKQIVKEESREALGLLTEAELVPRGVIGWFLIQWIVFPFLSRLLIRLLFEEESP